MPNPGSFQGSRGDFIDAQTQLYATAVKDGHIADTVADIQRRYLKRYPVTLDEHEEPSADWLAQVDDDKPDPELSPPDVAAMDQPSADRAIAEYTSVLTRIKFKKDQIKRRLNYIYTKNRSKEAAGEKDSTDPISSITAKLLGVELKLPRRKTAYNVWGPKHRAQVDPVFEKRVEELGAGKDQHAAIRSAVYKELFEELPPSEQEKWVDIALREHEKAVAEVKNNFRKSLIATPEDRQRVISALPKFIEPILDAVAEYTGWKVTFLAGGPEPADGGRLNMVSIHSGVTLGPVKMDFERAQRTAWKNHIAPAFGSFMKKCYTVQECRGISLPKDHSCVSISDMAGDTNSRLQVHTFESDAEHENAHKPKRLFEEIAKSGKLSKQRQPQTGTPSPPVRFNPLLGKKKTKLCTPPTKDSALVKLGPSPLSQSFVPKASGVDTSSPTTSSASTGGATDAASAAPTVNAVAASSDTNLDANAPGGADAASSTRAAAPINTAPAINSDSDPTANAGTAPSSAASVHANTSAHTGATPSASATLDSAAASLDAGAAPSAAAALDASAPCLGSSGTPISATTASLSAAAALDADTALNSSAPLTAVTTSDADAASLSYGAALAEGSCEGHSTRGPSPTPYLSPSPQGSPPSRPSSPTVSLPPSPQGSPQPVKTPIRFGGAVTVPNTSDIEDTPKKTRKRRAGSHGSAARSVSKRTKVAGSAGEGKRKGAPDAASNIPAKKQRMQRVDSAFSTPIPDDAHPWVKNALDLFTRHDLGPQWRSLVKLWVVFEEKFSFDEKRRPFLPPSGRPAAVGEWIKRARSSSWLPDNINVDKFANEFNSWWLGLQPSARVGDGNTLKRDGSGAVDWKCLQCSGLNGLLSAMAALFFWGYAAVDTPSAPVWEAAAEDMMYVLQEIVKGI